VEETGVPRQKPSTCHKPLDQHADKTCV
jgi:hypothetical protein